MASRKFKTEVSDLLHLLVHSLYSNREIFLRELISNASDALDKLKYLSLSDDALKGYVFDPMIEISFTEEGERVLVIKDNGIGMNEEDLNTNLGTIASSGTKKFLESLTQEEKKDSNLIGQFGVGFYSAFMVSKEIEVISRKAGEDKAYKWVSKGESTYSIEESERETQGTTVILHLKEDGYEFANRWQIENIVKTYSDHIAYPIYLEYDQETYEGKKDESGNDIKKKEHKRDRINSSSALWRRPKSSITDEEYKSFYKNNYYDSSNPLIYMHTQAEGATEYTTLFYIPEKAPFDMYYADYKPGVKLYVKRVYITDDDKTLLPTYLRFVRGIIDSEDLPLNVSREILQENRIMAAIRNGSVKKLLSEFKKLSESNPELFDKFIKEYNRPLKEGIVSDYANKETLLDIIRFKSTEKKGFTSLKAYKERMKEGQKAIYYISGGSENSLRNSPLLSAYKDKGYEVLIMDDEIDDYVLGYLYEFDGTPLKSINKKDAIDDIKSEEDKKKEEEKKDIAKRIKDALGDKVKDVIVSSRLKDIPSAIVFDENDPSLGIQKYLSRLGGQDAYVKPILEINPDSSLVKKAEDEAIKEDTLRDIAIVLFDTALLQEEVMPKDLFEYSKAISRLID